LPNRVFDFTIRVMGRKNLGKARIQVKIAPDVAAALKVEARRQKTDRSALIESIARPYLTRRGHKLPKPK
jgi:metal-responsive CopG/Arc/MetJ family transcriptional regulator